MRVPLLIVILLLATLPLAAVAADTDPFGFAEADYSAWGITGAPYPFDPAKNAQPNGYGCFPVGNGLVFGHLGVDGDFNTLRGITGPGYQTRDAAGKAEYWQPGSWPDMHPQLMQRGDGGELVPLPSWSSQSIQQLRGAALVRTIQRNHAIDLFTLTYAVPGRALLVQEFVLYASPDMTPVISLPLPDAQVNKSNQPYLTHGEQRLTISALGLQQAVGDQLEGSMLIPVFQEGAASLEIQLVRTADPSRSVYRAVIRYRFTEEGWIPPGFDKSAVPFAEQAVQHWQAWSADNLKFTTGDELLDDMLTQLPVTIETQRDHYSGGVAPMVSYHGYWVRDSLGALLCDLDNGRFNEVMRMLRYHRSACQHYGHCHMMVPLDLDLSHLDGWLPGQPGSVGCLSYIGNERADWAGVGVESAEVPSLIVLQHYLLWRTMHLAGEGDIADAFISEAWSFTTHNLLSMEYDPDYGVKFHGDETYTNGALYSTYDREECGAIGYPNGYIPTDYFSYDNTMLHRAAASAWLDMVLFTVDASGEDPAVLATLTGAMHVLEDMTRILGVQYGNILGAGSMALSPVTHERWPDPVAPIALRPGWLGLDYGPPRDTDYWQHTKDRLWDEPYPRTTPTSGYFTGHSLGYWLSAATTNGDKYYAELAVDKLLATASPEGAWCEVLGPDGLPVDIYGRTNRIRPWESGVNYHALVEALTRKLPWLYFDPTQQEWDPEPRHHGSRAAPYPFTSVLAITRDSGYLDRLLQDRRLTGLEPERVRAWDAGMPFRIADLRDALLGENIILLEQRQNVADGLLIPYLYFDEGVRGGLDRRTFKDEDFWQGAEMTRLLADYEAAGGTVITPETMEHQLGEDEVVALKMLVVLCTDTFTHEMTTAEVENFHHETAQWISWYDEVAGDRLRLELDYLQIDQYLSPGMCGPQGSEVYWMGYEDAQQLLIDRGIEDGNYDSVAFFWAWGNDHVMPDGGTARQAYGGAAQGPAADMAFLGAAGTISYFGAAVRTERPGGPSKTALHEYLHNLDAMFEYVGDPRLSHPDHMSRNMETLLAEVPGGFEKWGYTDDEVREMVAAELRNELHFPWPTQLVYYEQALQRIPREDYAGLLQNFGRRTVREPRQRLYEHFFLPEDTARYQVYFVEQDGLAETAVDEYDFVDKDHLLFTNTYWCGAPVPAGSQLACLCPELEIACPDVLVHVIGTDEDRIEINLAGTGDPANYATAQVWAELNGERRELQPGGKGLYTLELPTGLGESNDMVFHVEAGVFACTPVPVELRVRPTWELSVGYKPDDRGKLGQWFRVDGPARGYRIRALAKSRFNTIQELLCRDGLLQRVHTELEIAVASGTEALLSSSNMDPVALQAYPLTITVFDDFSGEPATSYTHYFPAQFNPSQLIADVPEPELPEYVLRAYPMVNGKPDRRVFTPDIVLNPETGHVFSGTIDSWEDAEVQLGISYSDEGLIIAGLVKDDQTPANGTWDSDRINLVFDAELNTTEDTYPDGAVGHSSWERDDYWMFLLPFQPDGPQTMRLGGEKPGGGVGYYGAVEGATARVTEDEGGYSVRWEIPWDELPYLDKPEPGTLIGFTLFYSDYDESLAELMYLTDWGGEDGIEWRFWDTGLLYFAE